MPNYANTQLYELIEHDENGEPVIYRGHSTQPLHQRLANHRKNFKLWTEGKYHYVSSFEVLKHGPARIELVRVVNCANKKEACREEGKFIREDPPCVNVVKYLYSSYEEYYEANREIILARVKKYTKANKESVNANKKKYYEANSEALKAKSNKIYHKNKETINAKNAEKVTCECGDVLTRGKLTRHRNRMTHIRKLIHC